MSVKEAVQSSAALEYIYVSCKHQRPNAISGELCFAEGAHLSRGALPEKLQQMFQTAGSFTVFSLLSHYLPYNLWGKYECGDYREGWLMRQRLSGCVSGPAQPLLFAPPWASGPAGPQPWECMALALRVCILPPTHQLISQTICMPRDEPGARGCGCPPHALPRPGWGIRLCLLGPADVGAPEISGLQPRELPSPQGPVRFIGNLVFVFEASRVVILILKRDKNALFQFKKVRDNSVRT